MRCGLRERGKDEVYDVLWDFDGVYWGALHTLSYVNGRFLISYIWEALWKETAG